jgi:iron(III) transport system ATP-binding protein
MQHATFVNMIEFRAVSKSFHGRPIIDGLDLSVNAGERLVLVGPSGCGKSTVLHLIAGLIVPEFGDILIEGQLVASDGKNLWEPQQRGVGMVFQDLALWPHMTTAQNVEFGLRARGMAARARKERIKEMGDLVGLGDYLDVRPGELSGGQQQRVALARALALEPRILLMDEPLSGLDNALNMQMRREILRLHANIGFTLVYVTHDCAEAGELGTRTIHLDQHRGGAFGTN